MPRAKRTPPFAYVSTTANGLRLRPEQARADPRLRAARVGIIPIRLETSQQAAAR